jgi:chromosome segregation ATPase
MNNLSKLLVQEDNISDDYDWEKIINESSMADFEYKLNNMNVEQPDFDQNDYLQSEYLQDDQNDRSALLKSIKKNRKMIKTICASAENTEQQLTDIVNEIISGDEKIYNAFSNLVDSLSDQLTANAEQITAIDAQISAITAQIVANGAQIVANGAQIANQDEKYDKLNTQIVYQFDRIYGTLNMILHIMKTRYG